MPPDDSTQTDTTLLRRSARGKDDEAWRDMFDRYNPMLLGWCRRHGLDREFAEEVCQLFWIDLLDKIQKFDCDHPHRQFRRWLRKCFVRKMINVIRQRSLERRGVVPLDEALDSDPIAWIARFPDDPGDEASPRLLALMKLAQQVRRDVCSRIHERTWQVFWHTTIDGWMPSETAEALGISYGTAYNYNERVARALTREGARYLAEFDGNGEGRGEP